MSTNLSIEGKIAHPKDLLVCRFVKNGDSIMTGGSDGVLRRIDATDLRMTMMFTDKDTEKHNSPITSIQFSPFTDNCLTAYAHGFVKLWDLQKGKCMKTIEESSQILGLGVSPVSKKFATTSDDSKVHLYDLETGQLIRDFQGSYKPGVSDGHTSRVFCVKFHPVNEHEVVSGGWDNTVQFWDERHPTSTRCITGTHICGEGIDFDKTGTKLLTCSFQTDKNLLLWSYDTGDLLVDLTVDNSKYYCGHFFGGHFLLAASSEPSTLRLMDTIKVHTVGVYKTNLSGLYSADCFEPPSNTRRAVITTRIATVASHYLLKFKFIIRISS